MVHFCHLMTLLSKPGTWIPFHWFYLFLFLSMDNHSFSVSNLTDYIEITLECYKYKRPPCAHIFECFSHWGMELFNRIRGLGDKDLLEKECHWVVGFEVWKAQDRLGSWSQPLAHMMVSSTSRTPHLHIPYHDVNGLSLWKCKQCPN